MQEEIVAHLLLMKKQYIKITCDLPEDHTAVGWHSDLYSHFVLILKSQDFISHRKVLHIY